jgi:predicted phosphoribosyltransferase
MEPILGRVPKSAWFSRRKKGPTGYPGKSMGAAMAVREGTQRTELEQLVEKNQRLLDEGASERERRRDEVQRARESLRKAQQLIRKAATSG